MKMVKKIKVLVTIDLTLDKPLNQEGADQIEVNDMLRDGEVTETAFKYYDEKGKKINPGE